MKVLEGVLSESKDYYIDAKKSIEGRLSSLPGGSVKERIIKGKKYYYHQQRRGKRVLHKYIGKEKPEPLLKQIKERKILEVELKKVNEALRLLGKIGSKKQSFTEKLSGLTAGKFGKSANDVQEFIDDLRGAVKSLFEERRRAGMPSVRLFAAQKHRSRYRLVISAAK